MSNEIEINESTNTETEDFNRGKTVAESRIETYHILGPGDMNSAGRLFGGQLMSWIDEVAAIVARHHAQTSVTTGSVDSLKFLHGAYLRDTIVISGHVTFVGSTSMEVKVETFVERLSGDRELINQAYLTLIALGPDNKPVRVPRLIVQTREEIDEWEMAKLRRQMRQ